MEGKIMMKRYATTSLMVCLVGYAAAASAVEPVAVLRHPQGRVYVSQNTTMGPAREGMPLYAGNRVVAVAGSRAEVAYPEGCVATLRENTLLAVKAGQCKKGFVAGFHGIEGFRDRTVGQAPPSSSLANADPGNEFKARMYQPVKTLVDSQGNAVSATTNMGLGADNVIDTKANKGNAWVYFNGCEVKVGPGEDVSIDELKERCKAGVGDNPDSGRTDPVAIAGSPIKTAGLKYPKGNVQVVRGTTTVPAAPNMPVFGNNRIKTGADSEVVVVFGGCGVEVEEDQRVDLDELKTWCLAPYWVAGGVAVMAVATREDKNASP
jgi:hypothetical protein